MSRADNRRRAKADRLLAKRQETASARAEVSARKQQQYDAFLDENGFRLTTRDKLFLPFKFLAGVLWWPIKIWLPDDSSQQQRRRGNYDNRT